MSNDDVYMTSTTPGASIVVYTGLSLKYQWTNTVVEIGVLLHVDTDMLEASEDVQMLE